jgi:hypothetical protein
MIIKKNRGIEISGSIFLSLFEFELIAVSVIISSVSPAESILKTD